MRKILLVGLVVVLGIQMIWLVFWGYHINNQYVKTSATVIELQPDKRGEYPTYEYYDKQGKRYVNDDRFSDQIQRSNPLYFVFGRDVGDEVSIYYEKGNPTDIMVLASAGALITIFAPLIFLPLPVAAYYAVLLLFKIKSFNRSTGRFE